MLDFAKTTASALWRKFWSSSIAICMFTVWFAECLPFASWIHVVSSLVPLLLLLFWVPWYNHMQLKSFYPFSSLASLIWEKIPGSSHLHDFNVYVLEWRNNTARSIPVNFLLFDSMLFDEVGSFVKFVVSCIVNSISIHLQLLKVGTFPSFISHILHWSGGMQCLLCVCLTRNVVYNH